MAKAGDKEVQIVQPQPKVSADEEVGVEARPALQAQGTSSGGAADPPGAAPDAMRRGERDSAGGTKWPAQCWKCLKCKCTGTSDHPPPSSA